MLAINPINNTKYNPSFSSKMDYSAIYKEMEKISLTQEEKILPKVNKSTKNILKAISLKFKGWVNEILFKLNWLRPIHRSRFGTNDNPINIDEYVNGAYKKYVRDWFGKLVIKEEKSPQGVIRVYNTTDLYFLQEENFPNGVVKIYGYDKYKNFKKRYLWGEQLVDGTKKIYSDKGKILEVYPPSDKRTLKQI